MGDVADMMIDGTLCEGCGVYLEGEYKDGEPWGFPRLCGDCANDRREMGHEVEFIGPDVGYVDCGPKPTLITKVACPICNKRVHPSGLVQHTEAKHNEND